MKKIFYLVLSLLLFISCSNEPDVTENPIPYAKGSDSLDTPFTPDSSFSDIPLDTTDFIRLDSVTIDSTDEDLADSDSPAKDSVIAKNESEKPEKQTIAEPEKPTVPEGSVQKPIKPANGKPVAVAVPKAEQPPVFDYRRMNLDAYRLGEKLTFDIKYGVILAGSGVMSVDKEFVYKNRIVQRVLFEARSNSAYSWIYKVEDKYVSYLDKYGIYPWKFIQKIREGSYKKDTEVEFDHVKGLAFERGKQYKIPSYTHDIISAFYYFRNNDLSSVKKGSIIKLSNYSKGKVHPLDVRIVGWQKVKVPAGSFNCIILEPMVKAGGLFKNEGTLFVWLTNDPLKIPVKVETKVVIGSITVELSKIEGVTRAIPARVSK
ncbi:MAG: DUF3108 domain-containing protein [Bacteroidetes bacterium]|nr:DUF3108 domain-containing protein [Bacteroidota bacterium]